ncbi:Ig-like domain-containing protein [Candidatus Nitrososphaera sp. FF02]|uniref:Ig-like domain-containing protein n=1 Tax=Candidatus Nitrososphaera sp. FF02 TaxID=3398226 RepID=UPI0039EA0589
MTPPPDARDRKIPANTTPGFLTRCAAIAALALLAVSIPAASALYLADSQEVETQKNTPVSFFLTGSAPQEFFFRVLLTAEHGSIEYDSTTGETLYTPDPDYVGTDSFTFETAAVAEPSWSGDSIGVVTITIHEGETETSSVEVEEDDKDRGTSRYAMLGEIVGVLEAYENNPVPDTNLSGYVLPSGAQIAEYGSLYEFGGTAYIGLVSDAWQQMHYYNSSLLSWYELSEAQRCFLVAVVMGGIPLDENGQPL